MGGKVGKFLIGAALIGAGILTGNAAIAGIGLKSLFLSVGASLALSSVVGSGGLQQKQGTVLGGISDTQAPLPVVYGKTKVGVRYADRRTGGTDNKYLYIVGALCHGSEDGTGIQGIDEIYFDDRLAMAPDGTIQAPFAGKLLIQRTYGADTGAVDSIVGGAFPTAWPATSKGLGVAYIVFRLEYDTEVYPNGEPAITAIVRGQKCKDPANLATAAVWTTNPAWCLYDFLASTRYGLGATAAEIDAASFATFATYYNTVVSKDNTTATTGPLFSCNGAVDVGQSVAENIKQLLTSCRGVLVYEGGKYRLLTRRVVSPTSFALSEANIVGDWNFNIPGIGEAPNVVHALYVEPGQGPIISAISNATPIQITTTTAHNYLTGDKAYIYVSGSTAQGLSPAVLGLYTITVTAATTFTLNDSEAPGTGYNANSCRVTTENFPHQAATRIWPRPGTSNGYLTADNSYEVIHELNLPFTNDVYTAEQIALVTLKEARAGTSVTLTATEAALALQVGDLVPVTHPTPGWVAKNFWVMGVFLVPGTMLVRLALLEYDSTAYTLDALSTVPTPPSTSLPNPFRCLPPADLNAFSSDDEARPDTDGSNRMSIRATWTLSLDPYVDYYEAQYRRAGETAWHPAPDQNRTDNEAEIHPVSEGVKYDVRVRAVNTLGVPSVWIEDSVTPSLLAKQRSGSFWIDDFSSQTPGRRWIQYGGAGIDGTFVDVYDPDALVGGKLGRAYGPVHMEHADSIPFDQNLLYVIRWRVRQLRNPSTGDKSFSIGVAGITQTPGQSRVFTHVNRFGQDSIDNQHYVVADGLKLPAGRAFTDFYGYIKGFAGGKVQLASTALTQTGLGSFSAANLVDGDTTPTKVGFTTDAALAGAVLNVDFGATAANWKTIVDARMHLSADGSVAAWVLEFSDDNVTWSVAT